MKTYWLVHDHTFDEEVGKIIAVCEIEVAALDYAKAYEKALNQDTPRMAVVKSAAEWNALGGYTMIEEFTNSEPGARAEQESARYGEEEP